VRGCAGLYGVCWLIIATNTKTNPHNGLCGFGLGCRVVYLKQPTGLPTIATNTVWQALYSGVCCGHAQLHLHNSGQGLGLRLGIGTILLSQPASKKYKLPLVFSNLPNMFGLLVGLGVAGCATPTNYGCRVILCPQPIFLGRAMHLLKHNARLRQCTLAIVR